MKITTLTANPCIDRTLVVDEIRRGKSHRVQKTLLDFSGKGINVALAASALGAEITAICLSHEDGAAEAFFWGASGSDPDAGACCGQGAYQHQAV